MGRDSEAAQQQAGEAKEAQQATQEAQEGQQGAQQAQVAAHGTKEAEDAQEVHVTDSHGQPGINKERHDREVNALNERIRELEAQVNEAAETKKAREDLQSQIGELRAELDTERNTAKLEREGCIDAETALLLLERYEGDVAKLKEAKPFLFDSGKPRGATGLRPSGGPSEEESERRRARIAAGLPVTDSK